MTITDNYDVAQLVSLVRAKSKHSDYQALHPILKNILGDDYRPSGKKEEQRLIHMARHVSLVGKTVLDIGANTGYFSFAALQSHAARVLSIEGNAEHARFIRVAARCLELTDRIEVRNEYFDFSEEHQERFDLIFCLNVLHHLGDDFGDKRLTADYAKAAMLKMLNDLSAQCKFLWFQLGFNWKGDRFKPLFSHGTKSELIDFVRRGTEDHWDIVDIAVYDHRVEAYANIDANNVQRIDSLGEFLNRPLFLMKSKVS